MEELSLPPSHSTLAIKYSNGLPSCRLSSRGTERLNNMKRVSFSTSRSPKIVIPNNLVVPTALVPPPVSTEYKSARLRKRNLQSSDIQSSTKRAKLREPLEGQFDKLDLLCSATLELGPLQDNPTGCSCPKSKCVALYCDCFKAGRRCGHSCSCLDCKNTVDESGPDGTRTKVNESVHLCLVSILY